MNNSIKDVNLEGKVVILSPEFYKGTQDERRFKCEGGFGCNPACIGRAVFGTFLSDGERARVNRDEILCLDPER